MGNEILRGRILKGQQMSHEDLRRYRRTRPRPTPLSVPVPRAPLVPLPCPYASLHWLTFSVPPCTPTARHTPVAHPTTNY